MNKNIFEIMEQKAASGLPRQAEYPLDSVTATVDGLELLFADGFRASLRWAMMGDPAGNRPVAFVSAGRFSVVMKGQKGQRMEAHSDHLHLLAQPGGRAGLDQLYARCEIAVGRSFTDRRKNIGISRTELAERTGISAARIKAIERGAYVSILELAPLADMLDVHLHDLFRIERSLSGELRQRVAASGPKVVL